MNEATAAVLIALNQYTDSTDEARIVLSAADAYLTSMEQLGAELRAADVIAPIAST
jgi:hypothetical protein